MAIEFPTTSAWQTLVDKVKDDSAADVAMAQETKLVKDRIDRARVAYRAQGRRD